MNRSNLLWGLILAPAFYYIGLIGGALLWPGYSHVNQYASELGSAASPFPAVFNTSIILCGLSALIGGVGLSSALARLSGRKGWAIAAGISISLWGVAMIIGGSFPMPNELHGAYGLAIAGQFTSLFSLLALRKVEGLNGLKIFLGIIFVASLTLFALMMGVAGPLRRANIGIWQRVNTALGIPYLTVLGWVLLQRLRRQ